MVILLLRTYASLTFKTCSRDANEKAARNTNGYRWIGQPTPFWGGWVRVIKIDQISFIIVAKFCCRTPLLFSIDFFEGLEEIHLRKKKNPKKVLCKWLAFVYYLNGCFSPTTIHKRLWYVMMRFVAFLQIVANATCYSFINLTNMRMQMFRCSYVWCISTCVTGYTPKSSPRDCLKSSLLNPLISSNIIICTNLVDSYVVPSWFTFDPLESFEVPNA